jgi:hypothetical protein
VKWQPVNVVTLLPHLRDQRFQPRIQFSDENGQSYLFFFQPLNISVQSVGVLRDFRLKVPESDVGLDACARDAHVQECY